MHILVLAQFWAHTIFNMLFIQPVHLNFTHFFSHSSSITGHIKKARNVLNGIWGERTNAEAEVEAPVLWPPDAKS